MHKFNMSFVFYFYILRLTSRIWTNPAIKGLKCESPAKWNSYQGFNFEHWPYPIMIPLHLDGFPLNYTRIWWTSGLHGNQTLSALEVLPPFQNKSYIMGLRSFFSLSAFRRARGVHSKVENFWHQFHWKPAILGRWHWSALNCIDVRRCRRVQISIVKQV